MASEVSGQILKDAVDRLRQDQETFGSHGGISLDISHGGLNGVMPNTVKEVAGVPFGRWISNSPDTTGTVHAVLLDYPKFFDFCGGEYRDKMITMLAAFVSSHSEVIEGINDTYNWEYDDSVKIGRTGESLQVVTNATITKTEPSITVTEKRGAPFRDLFEFIGRYGIMDPYTGTAIAHLLPKYEPGFAWTLDMSSFTILVFELDPTGTVVINAQTVPNMQPFTSGEWTMKKDINSGREVRRYTIQFTGFGIRGKQVVAMAQKYVDKITKSTKDALLTPSLYNAPVPGLGEDHAPGSLHSTSYNM